MQQLTPSSVAGCSSICMECGFENGSEEDDEQGMPEMFRPITLITLLSDHRCIAQQFGGQVGLLRHPLMIPPLITHLQYIPHANRAAISNDLNSMHGVVEHAAACLKTILADNCSSRILQLRKGIMEPQARQASLRGTPRMLAEGCSDVRYALQRRSFVGTQGIA